MNLIKWCEKNIKRIILWGICIILCPILIIHILFSIHSHITWIVAKWSAGELLNYFGAIIGSVATIIALVGTIIFTVNSQKEQNRLSVKPYLQTDYRPIYKHSEILNGESNGHLYITIDENISSCNQAPFKVRTTTPEKFEENKWEYLRNNYIIEYTLKNVGANSATNIKWTLNEKPIIPEFAISKDEIKKYIIIVNSSILKDNMKNLQLRYIYNDVFTIATYFQVENIKFIKDDGGLNTSQAKGDLITPPKLIL